ncbi:MAG TPA: septation protein A [Burkholderiaceae bacterium]|nr:septation protein A [Burkholderiaceae bacterium]HRZ01011.1 septation protein A [Burkholderiaceae bacterium]
MKFLFDLLPVILFFASFKFAQGSPDAAAAWANQWLGGGVTAAQAPVLIATLVTVLASLLQVGWLVLRGRKVDTMLWISLAVIVVFGGLTLWLHDETFIKWKPTILYWLFAAILAGGWAVGRNFIRTLLGAQMVLPDFAWTRLLFAWIGFFAFMGAANLFVAYNYPTETWVSFKLFGLTALLVVFALGMGVYAARHMKEEEQPRA